jgi:hypothetical protein
VVNIGGGFVASTLGISDDDFQSGRRSFSGNGASARVSTAWLLAVAMTEEGNDPVTGLRVLLGYDAATKAVGPISKIFDPAGNKWITLGNAAKAGIASVDEAKVAALQTFAAEKYLTVTVVK